MIRKTTKNRIKYISTYLKNGSSSNPPISDPKRDILNMYQNKLIVCRFLKVNQKLLLKFKSIEETSV